VGIGVSGTYEDDQAELTGIAMVRKRSLTLHVTLLRLAELKTSSSAPRPRVRSLDGHSTNATTTRASIPTKTRR
jgi:hypothetical protein